VNSRAVGNDIVDLAVTRARPEHPAFAQRVCSEAELRLLGASTDRARTLWCLFAAKEAAYKALSKLRGVRFVPRAFEVDESLTRVRHAELELKLRVFDGAEFVHALAFAGDREPLWDSQECRSPSTSAEVRALVCRLAASYLRERREAFAVVRDALGRAWDGYGPPRLLLRGRSAGLDVSLSHHGRYVACALIDCP
jgi:phosphopantetheinyl transferase (holo-ACP synthase)